MSTGMAELGQPIVNALVPKTPSSASAWGRALAMLQLPVLAFGTALAAGGVIIALTDLEVLGDLYDAAGKNLGTILSGEFTAGENTIPVNLSAYPSGAYFCRFIAGDRTEVIPVAIAR